MYAHLLDLYNPGMSMDEEERIRLTARRVGWELPVRRGNGLFGWVVSLLMGLMGWDGGGRGGFAWRYRTEDGIVLIPCVGYDMYCTILIDQ